MCFCEMVYSICYLGVWEVYVVIIFRVKFVMILEWFLELDYLVVNFKLFIYFNKIFGFFVFFLLRWGKVIRCRILVV